MLDDKECSLYDLRVDWIVLVLVCMVFMLLSCRKCCDLKTSSVKEGDFLCIYVFPLCSRRVLGFCKFLEFRNSKELLRSAPRDEMPATDWSQKIYLR